MADMAAARDGCAGRLRVNVCIVGAGWAGCAAAVEAVLAGHAVTLIEAAREPGGRARTLATRRTDGSTLLLDNGQHILIGAYTECLRLMREVGVHPDTALHREPLALVFPDGGGLTLPDLAAPLDAFVGIARARGWSPAERMALLVRATRWALMRFRCAPHKNVAQLCHGLPERLMQEFIAPLCVSALNTPPEQASGQVFLTVLHDSLLGGRGGSNLLLPRLPLGALLPEPTLRWLQARGHAVRLGQRVQALARVGSRWLVDGEAFDAVLLACPITEAARLVSGAEAAPSLLPRLQAWAQSAQTLAFGAIATIYAELPGATAPLLPRAMLALRAAPGQPAQFVFDCGRLRGHCGVLAFVVSAFAGEREALQEQVLRQAAQHLGLAGLEVLQTVVEKRATFACTPALVRPAPAITPDLLACGDYVAGPYPATLEGAVRLGVAAARALQGPEPDAALR